VEGGWTLDESVAFTRELQARGADFVHVSSGGLDPRQQIVAEPGYQLPFAARIKAETGLPITGIVAITDPHQAERVVADGTADLVALARGILYDPRWPWHAAQALGARVSAPPQ
jgi:2,4-dienoyl-CoA reductase-like NADH-dependent reductase (Old Yellow Enzyme family)